MKSILDTFSKDYLDDILVRCGHHSPGIEGNTISLRDIFPSFCIRSGLHALRISCPFCVHKNSANEIQYEFSPTLFIIESKFY